MAVPAEATIVVPLRVQQDAWLEHCVRSALVQTMPTLVLVVTSPHTPASNLAILDRLAATHPHLGYFKRPPGTAFAGAINAGWQRAHTPRVGLLLSDDWLAPDTVEQCLALEADIVATGHIGYRADGLTGLWERRLDQASFDALPTLERKANYVTHFFLFRREVVLAAGGVDPHIGHVGPDDYDLPWTLLERGASVAFTTRPLYCYRDHHDTRLTLRPHAQQLRDLRKVLAKHGVPPDEQERLMAQKARWFGVPWHVAHEDPHWYRVEPDADAPGPDLEALIAGLDAALVRIERVSDATAGRVGRASFRLELADGRVLKGRRLASTEQAEQVCALRPALAGLPLAPVLAHRGRALLEQWIPGVPLARLASEAGGIAPELIEQAGALLGRLAARAAALPAARVAPRKPHFTLSRLDAHLAALEGAGLLDHEQAQTLARRARDNAPTWLETGPIHQDLCPDNLVLTDDGLVLIDNESLAIGALDADLGWTRCRWPLDRASEAALLCGYARHRDPIGFIRHELFWAVVTLAGVADFRLRTAAPSEDVIAALAALAAGELPCPWVGGAPRPSPDGERVRVGLVCDYLAVGGQERALLNMLAGLDRQRFAPFLYAFRGGELEPRIRDLGVPLLLGSAKPPLAWKDGWTEQDQREKRQWRDTMAEALRRDGIDAVIVFAWPEAVPAAREAGVPVLIERLDGPSLLAKVADKSPFDRVVCQSATIRDDLLARAADLQLDPRRLELVYSGVDLERFDPARYDRAAERQRLGLGADELVIGYVGRLAAGKGLKLLLKAFARVVERRPATPLRLMLMGPDAGAQAELGAVQEQLGLGERLLFVPPREAVAPVLVVLDVFALPTQGEGIPNAVLEAMAMGLPIVAADVGSIHEVIEDNGVLVPEPTPTSFASALLHLLKNPERRAHCAASSRRIAARFGLRAAIARFEDMIVEELKRKRKCDDGTVGQAPGSA